jgi:hypothetical protein
VKKYSGVVDSDSLLTPEKYGEAIRPDIIDAIVYGKEVNPVIGVQVDSPEGDYGIETDYIRRTFPDRKVQYIETEPPVRLVNQDGIESGGIVPASFSGSFKTSIPDLVINNQGFVGEYGTRNDSTFVRGFDVYDFASSPDGGSGYKSKWGYTPSGTENSSNALIDIVNANTNPLVIRTPWVPIGDLDSIVSDLRITGKDGVRIGPEQMNLKSSGGKKFDGGGDKGQVRDNTRVSSVVPSDIGYVPAMERPLPASLGNARWDDGIMGVLPFIGDALQGVQAAREFVSRDPVSGLQTAGLLLVPNVAEKSLRGLFKKASSLDVPHVPIPDNYTVVPGGVRISEKDIAAYPGLSREEAISRILSEVDDAKRVTSGQIPLHGTLTPEEFGVRKPIPKSVKVELSRGTMPRMLKMREGLSPEEIMEFKAKFHDILNGEYTEFPKVTRDKAGIAATTNGQHFRGNDFLWVAKEESADTKNKVIGHELRHRVDKYLPLADEEKKILDEAYPEPFETAYPDKFPRWTTDDMKREKVTTNRDARAVLLGELSDDVHSPADIQNFIIDQATPLDIANAVYNSNGYGREFIRKLMKDNNGAGYTVEAMEKIREAMKRVGAVAGVGYLGKSLYDINGKPDVPEGFGVLRPEEYANGGRLFDNGGGKFLRINLQDQSPYPIDPRPFINYPIETPYRFRPEPDLGDYERPVETGMIQSIPVPIHNMLAAPRTGYGVLAESAAPVAPAVNLFSDEAKAERKLLQRYAESLLNDKASSPAGAKGPWQIMDITVQDYLNNGGKPGDIFNPEYNGGIRDWAFSVIPKRLGEFWSEDDSDINKLAKLYAAYNWGAGNLKKFLRSRIEAGLSNDDPYEWVEAIKNKGKRPDETKNYVKFLALNQDIPGSYLTREKFENAARVKGYMAEGGKLYADGGPEKTYQDYLDEYRSAKVALDAAKNNERAAKTALRDFRQGYTGPDGSWSPYWYWTLEGKRLDAESNVADKKLEEARNAYFSASDNIGNATLEKYRGTSSDPMAFWRGIATTTEGAEKYFRENAIRESAGAQEVADYFKSYANSPGYVRIRNNQEQWWKQRHPYKKIYEGTGKAMGYTDSLQGGIQVSPYGVFDLSVTPQISKMRTLPKAGMITVGTNEEKDWPYWFVLPHEMAHIANTFGVPSFSAQAEALSRNTNTSPGHDSKLEEKHSDKEAMMFLLYKEGIYDSRGDKDCTPEDIAKLREKYPGLRPLKQMDDEQAAWMINHVADAGEQETLYGNHLGNLSAKGGKIRIKPENRGKFTALKKRTGHSASWFKAHGTPAQIKMAVFALNSKKWKHGDGGPIDRYSPEQIREAIAKIKAGR